MPHHRIKQSWRGLLIKLRLQMVMTTRRTENVPTAMFNPLRQRIIGRRITRMESNYHVERFRRLVCFNRNRLKCKRRPAQILGGLIVATLLTLFFLPALYAQWFKVKKNSQTE